MKFVLLYISVVLGEFIATNEWQRVPENEPLPSGLHYRINLETGVKEAKILEQEEKSSEIVSVGEAKDEPSGVKLTDQQKKSLQKINDYLNSVEEDKKLKTFDELDVEMVVDFDLMENITRKFVGSDNLMVKIACLEELEYLVHQVDNAADFINLGGIDLMLDTIIRGNEIDLQIFASDVLAAAAQGNAAVQIHLVKRNGPKILLEKLSDENNIMVIKKVIYVLSTVIRNFPAAQNQFLKFNGIEILRKIVTKSTNVVRSVLTLISDIVEEELSVTNHKDDSKAANDRFQQYYNNDFVAAVKKSNWCEALLVGFDAQTGHHTILEAVFTTIKNLSCPIPVYHDKLVIEKAKYKTLCDAERVEIGSEDYFCSMLERVNGFLYKSEL